jgi:hypothetical protein
MYSGRQRLAGLRPRPSLQHTLGAGRTFVFLIRITQNILPNLRRSNARFILKFNPVFLKIGLIMSKGTAIYKNMVIISAATD